MKKRIGILGGSFNPVHNGHLIIARDAMRGCGLSEVLFVPCNKPSHKDNILVPAVHRLEMLSIALKNLPGFTASDADIRRGGITYSVDTVSQLTRERADAELVFIIGSDTLQDLHQWRDIEELFRLCRFAVMTRPGYEPAAVLKQSRLTEQQREVLLRNVLKGSRTSISSSDIRARIARGLNITHMVPREVADYIVKNHLYETIL